MCDVQFSLYIMDTSFFIDNFARLYCRKCIFKMFAVEPAAQPSVTEFLFSLLSFRTQRGTKDHSKRSGGPEFDAQLLYHKQSDYKKNTNSAQVRLHVSENLQRILERLFQYTFI